MPNQIKPRYRLGTQHMLDLAKDDATKIPERTLFVISEEGAGWKHAGKVVWRDEADRDGNPRMVWMVWGPDRIKDAYFLSAEDLQPLI